MSVLAKRVIWPRPRVRCLLKGSIPSTRVAHPKRKPRKRRDKRSASGLTEHSETVVEQALAHQVGDETSRAYRRGDAFLKRRVLMNDWEAYLLGRRRQARVTKTARRAA